MYCDFIVHFQRLQAHSGQPLVLFSGSLKAYVNERIDKAASELLRNLPYDPHIPRTNSIWQVPPRPPPRIRRPPAHAGRETNRADGGADSEEAESTANAYLHGVISRAPLKAWSESRHHASVFSETPFKYFRSSMKFCVDTHWPQFLGSGSRRPITAAGSAVKSLIPDCLVGAHGIEPWTSCL